MKGYTFQDGTKTRPGDYVVTSAIAAHLDPSLYDSPEEFNPNRHIGVETGERAKLLSSPSAEYLTFGFGSHAW